MAVAPAIQTKPSKKSSVESNSRLDEATDRTRLHITPLDPALLSTIVPPSVIPYASNVSYHTIQTFPDRRYGYVELPTADAEKLRRKLNGAILKGTKIRIDVARPVRVSAGFQTEDMAGSNKVGKSPKRQKREEGVIQGFELPNARKVQRGWTKAPSEKTKPGKSGKDKSKKTTITSFTDKPECLFRTKLPANISEPADEKQKKRKSKGNETILHEFKSTTKVPSFLRTSGLGDKEKAVTEYVEGKGWVDAQGNIVEKDTKRRKIVDTRLPSGQPAREPREIRKPVNKDGSDEASEDDESSSESDLEKAESSSGESSSDDESETDEEDEDKSSGSNISTENTDGFESESASSSSASRTDQDATPKRPSTKNVSIPATPPVAKEVHPLEALFKRPLQAASNVSQKPPLELSTSFSFFNAEGDDTESAVPPTPFTQHDLLERGLRSGAPTPDTPYPGKTFQFFPDDEEEDDDDVDDDAMDIQPSATRTSTSDSQIQHDQSFVDWFYEHRGETNRAWKHRRRVAMKEKRKRENKRLGPLGT